MKLNSLNQKFVRGSYSIQSPGDALFSVTQLYYAKAGNLVHVYFSGKTAYALSYGTKFTVTGLPGTIIQQDCRVTTAYAHGDVEVIAKSGNAGITLIESVAADYWFRFSFDYISGD